MAAMRLTLLAALLCGLLASAAAAYTDVDILNFALNLECLEAEFYNCAATGKPLSNALRGGGPLPVGCTKALLSPEMATLAADIAKDEVAHVALLRAALGSAAVACPAIALNKGFQMAANAALNTLLSPSFNPFYSDILFLHGAYIFEDVGVTAYHGAIGALAAAYTQTAGGLLAIEAYHAGAIRVALIDQADTYVFPYGAQVKAIVAAISALRANFGPDTGVILNGTSNLVPTDANALVYSRTVQQVLSIVYLGGTTKGGWFPQGTNGPINSTLI
eukprot:TRINITY_DN7812_c0_g1_i1.p1 TRINITY_DN7812_c0_g1~~TRINITY_DN7812_c0_g1_i1.p1  ORF type:complete len:276 (-),score=41.34 TRINITY_DN7812_c0_g1_i1:164-991(-)